ncbi:MAG: hypothetical protein ACR2OY_02795 [Boseongicola sp.]
MLSGIGHAIYRERKRLFFVTVLAFVAGYLFYARSEVQLFGLPAALITGLVYACVIAPVALLVCLFLPSFRFMIEAVAVSRLCVAWIVFCFPDVGATILSSPLLTATIVVGFGAAISRMLHGRVLRQALPSLRVRLAQFRIAYRVPARVVAGPLQQRFVGWVDDAVPIVA